MLREGSKVKVVFDKGTFWEWCPGVYTVCRTKYGDLGLDYNRTRSPYISNGDTEVPFRAFAPSVRFVNVKTGTAYYYSDIKQAIVYGDF